MKKQIIMMAAMLVAMVANAQSEVNIEKLWGIPAEPVDINEPMTVKSGVAFIGDTRPAEKITDGVMKGMQVKKNKRYFKQGAMNVVYATQLNFRGAASGIKKDGVIDVNAVPRSRMVQVKPTSSGKIIVFAAGTKEESKNLYIGVRNGDTFKNLAALPYIKDANVTGKKDAPLPVQAVDYTYADGDELWIYCEGGVNLFAVQFTGQFDANFAGSEPMAVVKAVKKARK